MYVWRSKVEGKVQMMREVKEVEGTCGLKPNGQNDGFPNCTPQDALFCQRTSDVSESDHTWSLTRGDGLSFFLFPKITKTPFPLTCILL
jgi:hypothetical protein